MRSARFLQAACKLTTSSTTCRQKHFKHKWLSDLGTEHPLCPISQQQTTSSRGNQSKDRSTTRGRSTRERDDLWRSQKSMINELPMYSVVSSPNDIEPAGDPRIVHHPRVDPHPDSPNPHGYGHNSNTRQTCRLHPGHNPGDPW